MESDIQYIGSINILRMSGTDNKKYPSVFQLRFIKYWQLSYQGWIIQKSLLSTEQVWLPVKTLRIFKEMYRTHNQTNHCIVLHVYILLHRSTSRVACVQRVISGTDISLTNQRAAFIKCMIEGKACTSLLQKWNWKQVLVIILKIFANWFLIKYR